MRITTRLCEFRKGDVIPEDAVYISTVRDDYSKILHFFLVKETEPLKEKISKLDL